MRACHAAGPGSITARDKFPGRGYFGVFPHVRQMSGSFRPPWIPEYHLVIIIILIISALLEWMSKWICVVFNVCVVSEVAMALSWSFIRVGPLCPCVVKKMCNDPKVMPSPKSSWLCHDPGDANHVKCTYKMED